MISLKLITALILAVLGICERSLFNLKSEMKQGQEELIREKAVEVRHLGSRTTSDTAITSSPTVNCYRSRQFTPGVISQTSLVSDPFPIAPKKTSNSGRPRFHLTDKEIDEICFTFHLLLSQKLYPTAQRLLDSILALHSDFSMRSTSSLLRRMKKIGFRYTATSKTKIPLDGISFVAQRAYYFRKMNELRLENAKVFFHDETWTNAGDERKSL